MLKNFMKVVGSLTFLLIAAFLVMGQARKPVPSTRPLIGYFTLIEAWAHQDGNAIEIHGFDDLEDSIAYIGFDANGDFNIVADGIELRNAGNITFEEDANRTGEGTCLFANGMPIGMATPGDCQGIKMEFDYGVTPDTTGDGKQAHGLDIKMTMDQCWDFASKPQNATIRGARIQGWSENDVSGKVMGAYINARAEGKAADSTATIDGGLTNTGLISIEARTELGSYSEVTATVVGLLLFHNQKTGSSLTGEYRAIQIDQALTGTQTGDKHAIYFADDHATGYAFTHAFGFDAALDGSGADQIAYAEADMDGDLDSQDKVDGWIKVEIDGVDMYIYLSSTRPQ